ncbi:MAG: hypothetical protein CM15mP83_5220 [Flavobacteriaceae bacterium]|nr:MAG: hypothetical protein CM15mP83_5220 [Flavobacteriaceae bacterium]
MDIQYTADTTTNELTVDADIRVLKPEIPVLIWGVSFWRSIGAIVHSGDYCL